MRFDSHLYDDENDEPVMCSDDGGGGRRRRSPTPVLLESNHRERLVKSAGDADVKEMWRTVAGGDSEDDREVAKMVDTAYCYGTDTKQQSPGDAPQQEDIAEFTNPFNRGRKKKKREKSAAEIALLVEQVLAELEFAAEEDVLLNIESKPAVNKLMKLPFLTDVLSKKQLQHEFLDHGILTVLKSWLEPLPDGSLPSINIRAAILKILTNFPIDLDQYERKEQLKKSGLGKVIMFLSRSDEETASNRKVAKELVDSWSRSIFNKSTRFEDMRKFDDERILLQGASGKRESKCGKWSSRQRTFRPEAMPLDFVVRPPSKIDPDLVRARAEHVVQDQCHLKMKKKLEQLKAPKRKQLQATKISVEGRTMVKYL
ncbi:protein IWS1 homolog 1 [Daucus carota subsp. sativus]|uniref:protein IWS1 homolog 1 n=1 Tax=Daucus carota subsp. sativus TaxID=79200 RepID=UPI0007EF44B9|nr:PREDICTED: protein IWS1 homolog [Daucus carota subsp. sativus]